MNENTKEYDRYKLRKVIPGLRAGAIFYHDKDDDIRGSLGCGCLKLAWTDDGNCQQNWCGDTFVFPGQLVAIRSWFKRLKGKYKGNDRKQKTMEMTVGDVVIRTTVETDPN